MFSLHICSSTTLPGPRWLPFDNFHCQAERGACSGPLGPRHTQPAAGPVPGHHNVLLCVRSAAEPEGLHNKLLFVCFVVVWSRSLSDGWPTLQSRGGEGGRGGGQGAMPAEPSERPRALKAAFVSPVPPPGLPGAKRYTISLLFAWKRLRHPIAIIYERKYLVFLWKVGGEAEFTSLLVLEVVFLPFVLPGQ